MKQLKFSKGKLFLTGVFLFAGLSLYAQTSLDLFTISGRFGPSQTAGKPMEGTNKEIGTLTNLKIPIMLSDRSIFYSELSYFISYVESDQNLGTDIANPLNLHGFILQTGLVQTLNDHQKLQLLLVPRFMTDFENITSANWQWGGVFLFENQYSDKLMLRFGAMYNTEMFGPALNPLLYVDWQITSKWSISGMLPIFAKINYQANENLSLGLSHFGLVTSYRLGNEAYTNDYIERTSIDLTMFARQRIVGNLYVEGRAGYALGRKYSQYAQDQKVDFRVMIFSVGDDRVLKNQLMKTGPIANLRLVYNLPLE